MMYSLFFCPCGKTDSDQPSSGLPLSHHQFVTITINNNVTSNCFNNQRKQTALTNDHLLPHPSLRPLSLPQVDS